MDTIKDSKRLTRRRHDAALKAQVLAECAKPEASVAGIALAHGLNANLVHKWRRMPTQRASQIEDLLPHRWQPASDARP